MVVLLARMHLIGFMWGDVSLSNTLFRRDAGAFAAYLVDAETGELHEQLTERATRARPDHRPDQPVRRVLRPRGRRAARRGPRSAGAGGDDREPLPRTVVRAHRRGGVRRQRDAPDRVAGPAPERLGFDVAELDITTDFAGSTIRIQPKVVDAGHHSRRLIRLTGLDTEENQARRLLNDLDYYRARTDQQGADEAIVAHQWLTERFEPVVNSVPAELRSQARAGRALPRGARAPLVRERAGRSGDPDLRCRRAATWTPCCSGLPDEALAVSSLESMGPLANPYDPSQGFVDEFAEKPYDPWEDEGTSRRPRDRGRSPRIPGHRLAARSGHQADARAVSLTAELRRIPTKG